jgi:hypothetical protein
MTGIGSTAGGVAYTAAASPGVSVDGPALIALKRKEDYYMIKIANYFVCLSVLAVGSSLAIAQTPAATPQQTQEANLKAYIEMMRKDLKKDKVSILTELMALDPQQSAKFWPIYNEYDQALVKLADQRIVFIRMYAENYESLTNEMATKIAMGMMDIEGRRVELRKQYFPRVSQALSGKDAARWLQIESQIEKLLDLQILANLPIIE